MRKVLLVAYPRNEACIPAWNERFGRPRAPFSNIWRIPTTVTGFQLIGAFADGGSLPQTFAARVSRSGQGFQIDADFEAFGNSFRQPRGKFNLAAIPGDMLVADAEFADLPVDGGSLSARTMRNAGLLLLQSDVQSSISKEATNAWVNPLVAVVDLDAEVDKYLLDFLTGEKSELRVEPCSDPENALGDLILDALTDRLRTSERQCPSRARSLAERLIWGTEHNVYRHRDFIGLDGCRGRFTITQFGGGQPQIDWSCSAGQSPAALEVARHWQRQLQLGSVKHAFDLNVHRPQPAPEFASDSRLQFVAASTQDMPSPLDLVTAIRNALENDSVGSFLSEQLGRPQVELPPLAAAWRNYSQNKWAMLSFVEELLALVFIHSEIVVSWPEYRSHIGDLTAPRDLIRQAHYNDRFQGRWVDLLRSRIPGWTGMLRQLLENLGSFSRQEHAVVRLPFAGEWWTPWMSSVFQAAATAHLVFPLPGEGPFYLGESLLGDRLGAHPSVPDHSDTPDWQKTIYL